MVMKKSKYVIHGYTITGSGIKGTRDLLFRTRKETVDFIKNTGGKATKAYRTGRRIRPYLTKK